MGDREFEACSEHSLMVAVGRCVGCGRVMCAGCEAFIGMVPRCGGCARTSARRRRTTSLRFQAALLAVGLAASLGLGMVLGIAQSEVDPPPLALIVK